MNNNKLQQPTTLQKVVNVIGTVFSIICLCYGMYSIIKEIIEYITGKPNEDESEETEVEDKIIVEE